MKISPLGPSKLRLEDRVGAHVTDKHGPVVHHRNSRRFACFCGRLCEWKIGAYAMRCECGGMHRRTIR